MSDKVIYPRDAWILVWSRLFSTRDDIMPIKTKLERAVRFIPDEEYRANAIRIADSGSEDAMQAFHLGFLIGAFATSEGVLAEDMEELLRTWDQRRRAETKRIKTVRKRITPKHQAIKDFWCDAFRRIGKLKATDRQTAEHFHGGPFQMDERHIQRLRSSQKWNELANGATSSTDATDTSQ